MIKESIQEYITIINIYATNIAATTYRHKGKKFGSNSIVGEFSTPTPLHQWTDYPEKKNQ